MNYVSHFQKQKVEYKHYKHGGGDGKIGKWGVRGRVHQNDGYIKKLYENHYLATQVKDVT